jgi:hypothetical protein
LLNLELDHWFWFRRGLNSELKSRGLQWWSLVAGAGQLHCPVVDIIVVF